MRRSLIAVATLLMVLACTRDQWQRSPGPDDAVSLVPWFSTMKKSVGIRIQQMPRDPVEGTVPITGAEAPLDLRPSNLPAVNRQVNPVEQTAESLERGKNRYDIYCGICHGEEGGGDGPVAEALLGIVPSIVTDQARDYSDGYLYSIIRHGRGVMPAYGEKVRGEDRWHVVNYVRVLQGTAP